MKLQETAAGPHGKIKKRKVTAIWKAVKPEGEAAKIAKAKAVEAERRGTAGGSQKERRHQAHQEKPEDKDVGHREGDPPERLDHLPARPKR